MPRSKGAVEFAKLPGKTLEIAQALGVSDNYISQLRSGRRLPGEQLAARIEQHWPHVTAPLWQQEPDVHLDAQGLLEVAGDDLPSIEQDTPALMSQRLLGHARGLERSFTGLAASGDRDAVRQLDMLAGIVVKLAKLSGTTLTVREILSSNAWRQIDEHIRAALIDLPNGAEVIDRLLESGIEELAGP